MHALCYAAQGMLQTLADAELVLRISSTEGAREAEAELCRRFAPRVRLYGLKHLGSADRAADLVQAVLLALLEGARAGRIDHAEHVDRFVLGTCRNTALRMRERDAKLEPTEATELEQHAGAVEPGFERVDVPLLLRCLRKLDDRARTVVLMSFQAERATEEIAQLLATSAGNVRVLRHRALLDLRGCLDRPAGAPS